MSAPASAISKLLLGSNPRQQMRVSQDLEAAIARADAAMYEAKRAGRDRVVASATAPGLKRDPVNITA